MVDFNIIYFRLYLSDSLISNWPIAVDGGRLVVDSNSKFAYRFGGSTHIFLCFKLSEKIHLVRTCVVVCFQVDIHAHNLAVEEITD